MRKEVGVMAGVILLLLVSMQSSFETSTVDFGNSSIVLKNPYSYPVHGHNWVISFYTDGVQDLFISTVEGTHFGVDLDYVALYCGLDDKSASVVIDGGLSVKNWSCNETNFLVVKELTSGKHSVSINYGSDFVVARNAAAEATQNQEFLNIQNFSIPFIQDHFSDSETVKTFTISGPFDQTIDFLMPTNSYNLFAELNIAGTFSTDVNQVSSNIYSIAAGFVLNETDPQTNITNPYDNIVIGRDGALTIFSYRNESWEIAEHFTSPNVFSTVEVGLFNETLYTHTKEVVYTMQNMLFVSNLTKDRLNNATMWNATPSLSDIVDLEIINVDSDVMNEIAVATSSSLYIYDDDGTLLNSAVGIATGIVEISGGDLDASPYDEIAVASTGDDLIQIYDYHAGFLRSISVTNPYALSVGELDGGSSRSEIVTTNGSKVIMLSSSLGYLDGVSFDPFSRVSVIEIGDALSTSAGNEAVVGFSGSGDLSGHFIVYDNSFSILWDYDTEAGSIFDIEIYDIGDQAGNELIVSDDNKNWYIQNGNNYPSDVDLYVGGDKVFNVTGLYSGNDTAEFHEELASYLFGCSDLCSVPIRVVANNYGNLILTFRTEYIYNLSDTAGYTTEYSYYSFENVTANRSYPYEHANIQYSNEIFDNLLFSYIGMLPGSSSCFFDGTYYSNYTDTFTACDISADPYVLLADGSTPSNSYFWFDGLESNFLSYYTLINDSNAIEQNITLTLQSNSSQDLTNTILEFNLSNTGNINNDTFYFKSGTTLYDITPLIMDRESCDSDSPDFDSFNYLGIDFGSCFEDTDDNSVVDFAKVSIDNLPSLTNMQFFVHRFNNYFPYLSSISLSDYNPPWGNIVDFNISIGDAESDNINVSLYLRIPGDANFIAYDWKQGAADSNITFNVLILENWIGMVEYYFNYTDGYHPRRLTNHYNNFIVRKHYAQVEYFSGNNSNVNRSGTSTAKLVARVYDLDSGSYVADGVLGRPYIGGNSFSITSTNSTGHLVVNFDPVFGYNPGPTEWYFTLNDGSYYYNISDMFNVNVWGSIFISPSNPTLDPVSGGDISRQLSGDYSNTIDWSFVSVMDDYGMNLIGLTNLSLFWRDTLVNYTANVSTYSGTITIPPVTPMFMDDDYVTLWLNKTWYNSYVYVSSDYVVHDSINFSYLNPPKDYVVYRTASLAPSSVTFSVNLTMDSSPVNGLNLSIQTELGECTPVINYTGGIYNCTYNPADISIPGNYTWWAVINHGGGNTERAPINGSFIIHSIVEVTELLPPNGSSIYGSSVDLFCNVSDYDLSPVSPQYPIYNKTVFFYNGSDLIGSSNTDTNGVANITWDISSVSSDISFNVTCNTTNEFSKYYTVFGGTSELVNELRVDLFEGLLVNSSMNQTEVSRVLRSGYNDTINLSVFVNDTDGTNITGATVFFEIYGDSADTCVGGVIEKGNGLYVCVYNPEDNATPGDYNWSVRAIKQYKINSSWSTNKTIKVKAFGTLEFLNDSLSFDRSDDAVLVSRFIDNSSLPIYSNYSCDWYIDGKYNGTTPINSSGYCSYVWNTDGTCYADLPAGSYGVVVNLSGIDDNFYVLDNNDTGIINLVDTSFVLDIVNPLLSDVIYRSEDIWLNVSVQDSCFNDISTFDVDWYYYSFVDMMNHSIGSVSNQTGYYWTLNKSVILGSSTIYANVTVPAISSIIDSVDVSFWGWAKISGATDVPALGTYMEGDIIPLRCNVTDANLTASDSEYNISGYNVSLYVNDSYMMSNLSQNGLAYFNWNSSGHIIQDSNYNLTCSLEFVSGLTYNRSPVLSEQNSSVLVFIDMLDPMEVNLTGPVNDTKVSLYGDEHYYSNTTNLTIYVSANSLPITNGVVSWQIPSGSCLEEINYSNGTYSCLYQPNSSLSPGEYNWSVFVNSFGKIGVQSGVRTLHLMGLTRSVLNTTYILRNEISEIKTQLYDTKNRTVNISGFNCTFYLDDKYLGWDLSDAFGVCLVNNDVRGNCSFDLGELELDTYVTGFSSFYNSSYLNETKDITVKDSNIIITVHSPIENSVNLRTSNILMNASAVDSCGPVTGHMFSWYDDSAFISLGNEFLFDPFLEPLGDHNLTVELYGPYYINTNESINYSIWAYSEVFFEAPTGNNFGLGYPIEILCGVNTSDTNQKIANYLVTLKEEATIVGTSYTNGSGTANFSWTPSVTGLRSLFCEIGPSKPYTPSFASALKVVNISDVDPPIIRSANFTPSQGYVNYFTFNFNSVVSDMSNVSFVWFKLNNSYYEENVTLTHRLTVNSTTYSFSESFVPSMGGVFDVYVYTNDTSGNVNSSFIGIINILNSTYGNFTLSPFSNQTVYNLTRDNHFSLEELFNLTNIGQTPMYNVSFIFSIPKGVMLNATNTDGMFLNEIHKTVPADLESFDFTYANYSFDCSNLLVGQSCYGLAGYEFFPNATVGNNSLIIYARWMNPNKQYVVMVKEVLIDVLNNTVANTDIDEISALITPGHNEVIANFTLQAYGTTPLENVTFKIIPQTAPPTLMNDDWFSFQPTHTYSNLTKLSDTSVNITMNVPASNYTYEFLNYRYPASSWEYKFWVLVNVTDDKTYCNYASACEFTIPVSVVVGASKWSLIDGGIMSSEQIDQRIAYNQTSLLGYISVYNYQTQSTGDIPFDILNLPVDLLNLNTSDFLYFDNTSVTAKRSSETRVPVYYTTNETTGNFTGQIVFDAVSDNIIPNQLNISVKLEIVPFGVFLKNPTEIEPYTDLYAGDLLSAKAKVFYNGSALENNVYFVLNISNTPAEVIEQYYNDTDELWYFEFTAPYIENNPINNYLKFTATFDGVEAFDFENNSLIYVDVTPPWFENPYVDFIEPGEDATLKIDIFDNLNVNETLVNITYINESGVNVTDVYNLTLFDKNTYSVTLPDMIEGNYRVRFIAYDNYSTNESRLNGIDIRHIGYYDWWFGVYNKIRVFGKVNNRVGTGQKGNILLGNVNSFNENVFNVPLDNFGSYDKIVHARNYSLAFNSSTSDSNLKMLLVLYDVDLSNVNNTYDFLDVDLKDDINGYTIDERKVYKVIGFDSLFDSPGEIYIDYSDLVIDDINKMFLYSCSLWDFNTEECIGTWTKLEQRSYVIFEDTTYFHSYFNFVHNGAIALVHDVPPIDQNNFVSMNTQTSTGQIKTSVLQKVLEEKLEESREEILNETRSIIDPYLDSLSSFEEFNKKYGLNIEEVNRILYQGENLTIPIYLSNPTGESLDVKLGFSDRLSDLISFKKYELVIDPSRETFFDVHINVPKDYSPGVYTGNLQILAGDDAILIPVSLRIVEPDSLQLQLFVKLLGDNVVIGKDLGLDVELYNPSNEMKNVSLGFEVYDMNNNLLYTITRLVDLNTYYNNVSLLTLPTNLTEGEYFVKTKVSYDLNGFLKEFSRVNRFEVVNPLLYRLIFGVPIWLILAIVLGVSVILGSVRVQQFVVEKSRRYHLPVYFKDLPLVKTPYRVSLGKLSEYEKEVFFDLDNLMTHTIIAGSTGGGKTVAAQGVVEHALDKDVGVVVFDPTAQWTGFFRKNDDSKMFSYYSQFNMRKKDARSYPGTIVVIEDALQKIDLKKHINPGEITVFSLHKLEPREIDIFVASTVKQVFSQGLDETPHLKSLMIYDEVHRLLPKFGGSGAGFVQIERACREFRKWGIGLVLISQVLSDFVGEIKANINTEVQLRTKDEADLERLKTKYGEEVLRSVVKAETGNGMMNNPAYNKGKPFMVNFRPLLHSPRRLKESDLEKYIDYSNKLEEIIYNVGLLESKEVDVFDFNLEIKLAKEKLCSGSFTMVDMYLEGLNSRLDETLSANNLSREKPKVEKIDMDELKDEINRARKSHGVIGTKKEVKQQSDSSSSYYDKFLDKLEGTSPAKESTNLGKIESFEMPAELESTKPVVKEVSKPVESVKSSRDEDINVRYKSLQSRIDTLKRAGLNTKMLEMKLKYADSDVSALQKHYIEKYHTNALNKLNDLENEIVLSEHITSMKETISNYLKKGVSESQLRSKLKSQGWPEDSINEIFKLV